MKFDKTTLLIILIVIAGLSLLLYPSFADWVNSFKQNQAISYYEETLEKITEADYQKMFDDAAAYNEELRQHKIPFSTYEQVSGYYELLDFGRGIIGYIKIPKINVELAIYHGTSEGVLQEAVGHVEGSSLPVGQPNTHTVLSAHRGLPSAKLFTDLDELVVGDRFTVTVGNRKFTYEVDQILIVLPSQVEDLYVQEGEDLVTLVTCTPYGVNSHRMLVRGHRVESTASPGTQRIVADAMQVEPMAVACVLMAVIVPVGVLVIILMDKKKKTKN